MVEIELSIMARGNDPIGDLLPLLDQFEAEHHIHVKVTVLTWDIAWNEIVKMALYSDGPDVSEIGTSWTGNFIAMNALRPFTSSELVALGGSAAFLPSSWQSSMVLGEKEVCAIPWLADTRLIYFRRDLLDKAGVDSAAAFSSPEQVALTFGRLRDSGVNMPWVAPTHSGLFTLHNVASWIWGAGGDFVTTNGKRVIFDQPQARAGMKAYFDLYRYLGSEALHLNGYQADRAFVQGQAAVMISGPREGLVNRSSNPDWGVALPAGVPFIGGSNLVIWQHTRRDRDALQLVKFLTGKQAQISYAPRTGLLPVHLETLASPAFINDPIHALMAQALHAGRSFPAMRLWGLIEDKLRITFSGLSEDILEQSASGIDALLDKYLTPLAEQLNITLGVT